METALGTGVLSHVSDGPRGGVWVVEGGREDVVGAVVEMGRGGWEVLGMGCGGSEGRVFLVHACGRGGPDVGVEEEGGERKGKGRAAVGGGGTGGVGGRDKGKGKEGEGEGKGRKRDRVMGLVGRIVGKVKKEVEADELVGRIMERVR